ncbi:hypothetical protein M0R45_007669 [Rubus argutus]|uniref:Uncharacterized protein n=1 Tax=Rubus argutus TaxID=59490 RepID=A0AAW1XZC0_RUBAR
MLVPPYIAGYSGDVKKEITGEGDRWDQGYDVTARFLDYCTSLKDGFVAELNNELKTGYSVNYFSDILGRNADQLWADYKAKYSKPAQGQPIALFCTS